MLVNMVPVTSVSPMMLVGPSIPFFADAVQLLFDEGFVLNGNQWELIDSVGTREGEIQPGRYYAPDGVDDTAVAPVSFANETIHYWDGTQEQTLTVPADGRILLPTGEFSNAYREDGSGNLINYWPCGETAGSVMYDARGNQNLTLEGHNPASFFSTGINHRNMQNEFGYTNDQTLGLLPVKITASGDPIRQDVLGDSPDFFGRVKYNAKLVGGSVGVFDGIDDYGSIPVRINPSEGVYIAGWIKINQYADNGALFSSGGYSGSVQGISSLMTSTGMIRLFISNGTTLTSRSTGYILPLNEFVFYEVIWAGSASDDLILRIDGQQVYSVVAGTTWSGDSAADISLSGYLNGLFGTVNISYSRFMYRNSMKEYDIMFSTGAENIAYDVAPASNGRQPANCTLMNITEATFWGTDSESMHYNLFNGFDLWQNDTTDAYLRVPFDNTGNSILTEGDTLSGYTWVSRNPSGKWHNNAETQIEQYAVPELYSADNPQKYFYGIDLEDGDSLVVGTSYIIKSQSTVDFTTAGATDNYIGNVFTATATLTLGSGDSVRIVNSDGTLRQISHDEIDYVVYEHHPQFITFANAENNKKRRMITYKTARTGDQIDTVLRFINDKVTRDHNRLPLLDNNGDIQYED